PVALDEATHAGEVVQRPARLRRRVAGHAPRDNAASVRAGNPETVLGIERLPQAAGLRRQMIGHGATSPYVLNASHVTGIRPRKISAAGRAQSGISCWAFGAPRSDNQCIRLRAFAVQ